ncbi:unnamed protein product, partial [Trichogramma brassicae]
MAITIFEKQQYKLCNNAIFGKTMENVRKRIDVKLVSGWDGRYGAEAQISKPNFHSRAIFDENLVAIQLSKTSVTIDKPVYVGFSILDISKTQLYRFHYDFMLDRFGSNCKVLYTDTDSLVYEIRRQNVYEVMKKHEDNINEFDTFDYKKDKSIRNAITSGKLQKIGLMKDELCGKILRRFCGLRSKMYSVDIQNGGFIKKIKGIKSSVVKNTITFDDYLQCLRENTIISREQHNIRSRLHVLRSEKERKIALSPHDDKRYLVPGTVDTLPWGSQRHRERASSQEAKPPFSRAYGIISTKSACHVSSNPRHIHPSPRIVARRAGLCNSSTRSFFLTHLLMLLSSQTDSFFVPTQFLSFEFIFNLFVRLALILFILKYSVSKFIASRASAGALTLHRRLSSISKSRPSSFSPRLKIHRSTVVEWQYNLPVSVDVPRGVIQFLRIRPITHGTH